MAKPAGKRKTSTSDLVVSGDEDEATSSDGSVRSSLEKQDDSCSVELMDKDFFSFEKVGSFPIMFADLFKEKSTSQGVGSCHYIKPTEDDILETVDTDINKVIGLLGHCLLGCFAGRFPGLKAVRNLVDKWKTECEILPHQSGWVIFQFQN